MALNETMKAASESQLAAARDAGTPIRLVAGPGTGKSASIEERVCWLLTAGAAPATVCALSFTRASSADLRTRIHAACASRGLDAQSITVSTIHSLALRMLRQAGVLSRYPADPLVLDTWEQQHLFDAEFELASGIRSKPRRESVREFFESLWQTGLDAAPNYLPPNPPISDAERDSFLAFHPQFTTTYSCVLPGEMVQRCVEMLRAGTLPDAVFADIRHLIVDEYQDLNPMDQEFIDGLVGRCDSTMIAGDDDQSIYSFRHASPAGLIEFSSRHESTTSHVLSICFRCMTSIVEFANALIQRRASPNRIPKSLDSIYSHTEPPREGTVIRWRFRTEADEATAIAASCKALIDGGVSADDILILLGNVRTLSSKIEEALDAVGTLYEPPRTESFQDSENGRYAIGLLRSVANPRDLVARRLLLGIRRGVGARTCHAVTQSILNNNLSFESVVDPALPLPSEVFSDRERRAIESVRADLTSLAGWTILDRWTDRVAEVERLLVSARGESAAEQLQEFVSAMPTEATLAEVLELLRAEGPTASDVVRRQVHERLGTPPGELECHPRIRIMTMHGAKGLSSKIVFIPGLEDGILPSERSLRHPGLVLEAARLLYVSITRAKAACVMSYSERRFVNGASRTQTASRFCTDVGGTFKRPDSGLSEDEVAKIVADCESLRLR